jgi:hypothetical protein
MIGLTRGVGWVIFWVAAVVLALLIVPIMHNTSAIPMMVFSIIVLVVSSALWGTGVIGRRLAVLGATFVLLLSILSFFLPLTAKRVPEKVKSFDAWLASDPTSTYHPPAPSVEALVPTESCKTPCSAFVGWRYKVRTDGDPFRAKYHGCKDWVEHPGKGDYKTPECFLAGIAEFDNPHQSILIQVYKKVNI